MRSRLVRRCDSGGTLLALPGVAHAQEAVLSGTVTDATGAVLPGVSSGPSTKRRATPSRR